LIRSSKTLNAALGCDSHRQVQARHQHQGFSSHLDTGAVGVPACDHLGMGEDGRAELREEDPGASFALGGSATLQPCSSGAFLRGGVSDVDCVLPQGELHHEQHQQ